MTIAMTHLFISSSLRLLKWDDDDNDEKGRRPNEPALHFKFTSSYRHCGWKDGKWDDDDDIEEMQEDKRAVSADPSYHADYCSGDTGVWYT